MKSCGTTKIATYLALIRHSPNPNPKQNANLTLTLTLTYLAITRRCGVQTAPSTCRKTSPNPSPKPNPDPMAGVTTTIVPTFLL